jgi:thiamine pyrophosphokinase
LYVLIFANGKFKNTSQTSALLEGADYIIAADGGANHCHALSLVPDYILGDMDSIAADKLEYFKNLQVKIEKHPVRKNATDLELALNHADTISATRLHIFGALGGRWDMSLSNILLCSAGIYSKMSISVSNQDCLIQILHPGITTIVGEIGERISLVPLMVEATDVSLSGFEYPLKNQTIPFGSTLGVSNVLAAPQAKVQFKSGVLLCIHS